MQQATKEPFHMTIVGATGTGKTHFLLKLIEKEYKGYFNRIYLICPTFHKKKLQRMGLHIGRRSYRPTLFSKRH